MAGEAVDLDALGDEVLNLGRSETELGFLENGMMDMSGSTMTEEELQTLYEKNGLKGWDDSTEARLKKIRTKLTEVHDSKARKEKQWYDLKHEAQDLGIEIDEIKPKDKPLPDSPDAYVPDQVVTEPIKVKQRPIIKIPKTIDTRLRPPKTDTIESGLRRRLQFSDVDLDEPFHTEEERLIAKSDMKPFDIQDASSLRKSANREQIDRWVEESKTATPERRQNAVRRITRFNANRSGVLRRYFLIKNLL